MSNGCDIAMMFRSVYLFEVVCFLLLIKIPIKSKVRVNVYNSTEQYCQYCSVFSIPFILRAIRLLVKWDVIVYIYIYIYIYERLL